MRLLRTLAPAAVFAALISSPAYAQGGRQFRDAWFWGLKTGALSYSSESTTNGGAPLVGGEWLITRSTGGLYISFDQAFFNTRGGYVDRDPDSTRAFVRPVTLNNLRRFTLAAMVFPAQTPKWHPYAGLGFQYNAIGNASVVGPLANPLRLAIALDSIRARKSAVSPVLVAGTQLRLSPFSLFLQGTVSPMQETFFLYNSRGKSANFAAEFGIRYNVGTSIDRSRP